MTFNTVITNYNTRFNRILTESTEKNKNILPNQCCNGKDVDGGWNVKCKQARLKGCTKTEKGISDNSNIVPRNLYFFRKHLI